ncbi:hypothetical protein ACPAY5_07430 [Staphylococcus caledonicus]|uniref:hypothetical protein n=1 Tax=Staphylococcus caledonicus TaxID=2741333 RepID=UPI003C2EC818
MEDLNFYINEMKTEVIGADLKTKINTVITMIEEHMESKENFMDILKADGKHMEVYCVKEYYQNDYVVMAVLNSILKDVDFMQKEIATHHNSALDKLEASSISSDQTEIENADK